MDEHDVKNSGMREFNSFVLEAIKMHNFFEQHASRQFKERLNSLRPDSVRQWGKMTPAQTLAHLCKGMEQAMGEVRPPECS